MYFGMLMVVGNICCLLHIFKYKVKNTAHTYITVPQNKCVVLTTLTSSSVC